MIGDVGLFIKYEREDKYRFYFEIENILQNPNIDFNICQSADIFFFDVVSNKAKTEVEALIPHKIDRSDHEGFFLKELMHNSFGVLPSNKQWDERRKFYIRTLGINFASQYIELMINTVDNWAKNLPADKVLDIGFEMSRVTFRIISKILFGRDLDKMKKWVYISPFEGYREEMSFEDWYLKYSKDELLIFMSPKRALLPFMYKNRLINPFKASRNNKISIDQTLREFLDSSTDDQSIYRQVLNSGKFTKEEVFYDTELLLFAGFDTSSHGITSMIYFLYKYPLTLSKLMGELKTNGVLDLNPKQGSNLKDIYEKWDYLNYVVKEGLRIDPPASKSLNYTVKKDEWLLIRIKLQPLFMKWNFHQMRFSKGRRLKFNKGRSNLWTSLSL